METSNEAKGLSETKSSDTVIDLKAHVDSTDSGKVLFSSLSMYNALLTESLKLFLY